MTKTKAQVEKKKRDTEKRKKTEKAILKIAAAQSEPSPKQAPAVPGVESKAIND